MWSAVIVCMGVSSHRRFFLKIFYLNWGIQKRRMPIGGSMIHLGCTWLSWPTLSLQQGWGLGWAYRVSWWFN